MDPRDRHMHRRQCPSRRGPIFYLLLLLVLSSFILFTFTYRHSSGPTIGSLFETPYVDPRPIRDLSIELHPKDHIRRLPTSLTHHWNITKGVRAPDGVNKAVYLINGKHLPNLSATGFTDLLGQANFPVLRLKRGRVIKLLLLFQTNYKMKRVLQFIGMDCI